MSAPEGDNTNILDAINKMIEALEQKLNTRMNGLDDRFNNLDFVRKHEFSAAISDLETRKADRSELEDLMEKMNERFAALENLINGIEIPE